MIQEIPTRRYWASDGGWTQDIEKAIAFDNKSAAIGAAQAQEFQNVHLVMSRELKEWEIIPYAPGIKTIDDFIR